MPNRFLLLRAFTACLLSACLASAVLAQERTRTVTGRVVDSADQPVSGVLVFVDDESINSAAGSTTTGAVGEFRLEVYAPGTHLFQFRREGFAPSSFRLSVAQDDADRLDIGVISLVEGPDPTTTLTGRVVQGASGEAITGAVVQLNGNPIAVSGSDGRFRVPGVPISWGNNHLLVGGLSYTDETTELWIADSNETFTLNVMLHPSPIELAGLVADVAATPFVSTKMEPFYARRDSRLGTFLTGPEIVAMNPSTFTDVFRRVPGVIMGLPGDAIRGGRGKVTGMRIRFRRASNLLSEGGDCLSPVIFLDGLFVGGGPKSYVNLDDLVSAEEVGGIELYASAVRVPVEFNRTGSGCGVIAIWTRVGLS